MRVWAAIAAAFAAISLMTAPALAQNLSLRAADWATRLLAADLLPTNGGRAAIGAEGIDLAVRVTIAPNAGGVARVIRYEARGSELRLVLRRFTGHPSAGWWLWGPDQPYVSTPAANTRPEIERLARSSVSLAGLGAATEDASCPTGERGFVEIFQGGRAVSATRMCLTGADPVTLLMRRLSDLAGSRDEEEMAAAVRAELLAADRAFAAAAVADPAAAVTRFAQADARILRAGAAPTTARGPSLITAGRTPEGARVSSRGDMGWTWGHAGTHSYVTVWTRDDNSGDWRIASDSATANSR